MRIFESFLFLMVLISYFNLFVLKDRLKSWALSGCMLIVFLLHLIFEGYRLTMFPLYILTLVFLMVGFRGQVVKVQGVKVQGVYKIIRGIGIAFLTLLLIIGTVLPFLLPVADIMKPSGNYAVGTTYLEFTDTSRKEIFTETGAYRKIAVKVWYPAKSQGKKVQKYFPDSKFGKLLSDGMGLPNVFSQLAYTKTNSYQEADIAISNKRYPVILFSGGHGSFNGQNTTQMEELASHGYVVFAMSHPYEDFASLYPDGSIITVNKEHTKTFTDNLLKAVNNYDKDKTTAEYEKYLIEHVPVVKESLNVCVEDTNFAAKEIEKLNSGELPGIFKDRLDTGNMGLFGMSFGGAIAGQSCLTNSSFKAFINMDGTPFGDTYNTVIKQPFMLLCSEAHKQELLGGYSDNQKNYMIVSVKGTKHYDFTDFTYLLPGFRYLGILGKDGGYTQERILNDYILSFFNKYLKGEKEPILENSQPKYEGVMVELR